MRRAGLLCAASIGLIVLGLSTARADRAREPLSRVEAPRSTDRAALAVRMEVPSDHRVQSGFAVWQGLDLGWGYNHRINRLGSMLEPRAPAEADADCDFAGGDRQVRCRTDLTLAAASGTGHDTALLRSYHALVRASGVRAGGATVELHLKGDEAKNAFEPEPLCAEQTARVPMPGIEPKEEELLAMLGGFDLLSLDDADQLRHLSLEVGEPTPAGDGLVEVPVTACLAMDCGTLECDRADDFDYSLLVPVQVISSRRGAAHWNVQRYGLRYRWDEVRPLLRSRLPRPAPVGEARKGPPVDAVQGVTSTAGLKGFSVSVRGARAKNDLHLLDFGLAVHPVELHGMGAPRVDLFLRNWKPGMEKVLDRTTAQASPGHSMWSHREGGRASWTVDVVELSFADATILHQVVSEEITWDGFGRTANPETDPEQASEVRVPLHLLLEERGR